MSTPLDTAAKVLLNAAPAGLVGLAYPAARARVVGADDSELPALRRQVDKVLRLRVPRVGGLVTLHVEVLAAWKSDVPWRVLEYWARLRRRRRRVESLVVVLKPGRKQGRPRDGWVEPSVFGGTLLALRIRVIRAWELSVESLLEAEEPGLLPLVPFARGAKLEHIEMAAQRIGLVRGKRARGDLAGALETFATNVFRGVSWSAMIPRRWAMESEFWRLARAEATIEILTDQLRASLGAAPAAPYIRRIASCSDPTTLKRAARLMITKREPGALREALDRLFPARPKARARASARRSG